jgi:hypothetical protein
MQNDVGIAEAGAKHSVTSFHRRRPLFWLVLIFCCGIAIDRSAAPTLSGVGGLFLASFAAGAAYLFLRHGRSKPARHWPWLFGAVLALSSGMLVDALRWRIPSADDVSRRTPATSSFAFLRGTIIETSRQKSSEQSIWTLDLSALGQSEDSLTPALGRVQLRVAPPLEKGGAGGSSESFDSQFGEGAAGDHRPGQFRLRGVS